MAEQRARLQRLVDQGDTDALRRLVVDLRRADDRDALQALLVEHATPLSRWTAPEQTHDYRTVFALGDALLRALEALHARGHLQIRWDRDAIHVLDEGPPTSPWHPARFEVLDLGPRLARWDPDGVDWSQPDLGLGGHARYLSPEQLTRSHEVGVAHDLYAVGLVVCELYTGLQPWELPGLPLMEMLSARLAPDQHHPGRHIPGHARHGTLERWLQTALAVDPMHRHGSAREMRRALLGAAAAAPQRHRIRDPEPRP